MSKKKKRLGDLLIENNIITEEQLKFFLELQKTTGRKLGEILVSQNIITEKQMTKLLQLQLGIDFIDLNNTDISPDLVKIIPIELAKRYNIVPINMEKNRLTLAMEDPFDFVAIEDVERVTKRKVAPVLAFGESIKAAINNIYGIDYAKRAVNDYARERNLSDIAEQIQSASDNEINNAPVVRLVNLIIEQAVSVGASDIHIEPMKDDIRVRMRVDGMLQSILNLPSHIHSALLTRIKIVSNMNIAEKRAPQDGRLNMTVTGNEIDIRISVIPGINGEKAVLRLLNRTNFLRSRQDLGFTEENLIKFDDITKHSHGMVLVTGPTGSGKSTTLYTLLNELNREPYNITTIEDPVEYTMQGINQIQVNTAAGMTFASGLRSILRQDPDIVMVGEIRDSETAEIAIRAAITGHLVMSTLHTNDAVSTISRLTDMGIEPYLLSSSLVAVISQRLLRRICPGCRRSYTPDKFELEYLEKTSDEISVLYKGEGCSMCNFTGYKGRVPVHEILTVSKKIRMMIGKRESEDIMRDTAVADGMSTMRSECIKMLLNGTTTFEEIIRISYN